VLSMRMNEKYVVSAVAGGLSLPADDIRYALSKMGDILSKKKLHLKVGVMHLVLQMDEGELTTARAIAEKLKPIIRNRDSATIMSVAATFRLLVKWGYLQRTKVKSVVCYRRLSDV
jgi:hypothetical protein